MNNYTQLCLEERRTIYKLLEAGRSKTDIAARLGRHRSTVFREIQRNTFYDEDPYMSGYFHVNAQEFARRRQENLTKLNQNPALKVYIIDGLRDLLSPEQIAGELKRLGIKGFYVCHESIYRFIYSTEGKALKLYRYLCRSLKSRRKRFKRKPRCLRGIPKHMGIDFRPETINKRERFGHWEGDLVNFRRQYGLANITSLVERVSRYTVILKNEDRRSSGVLTRIRESFAHLPKHARLSITFDRGSEFLSYPLLQVACYYCDPQAPWQKGTNENTNGRIRRFLPRDTNINEVTPFELQAIALRLNHTPRKCLEFRTPHEVFFEHLHDQQSEISCLT